MGDSSLLPRVLWWFFREMSEWTLCQMLQRRQLMQVSSFSSQRRSCLTFLKWDACWTGHENVTRPHQHVANQLQLWVKLNISDNWEKTVLLEVNLCNWHQSNYQDMTPHFTWCQTTPLLTPIRTKYDTRFKNYGEEWYSTQVNSCFCVQFLQYKTKSSLHLHATVFRQWLAQSQTHAIGWTDVVWPSQVTQTKRSSVWCLK